jgi:hypothetical protein
MKLDKIFLKINSRFSQELTAWAGDLNLLVEDFSEKGEDALDAIDGLVIFSENQTEDKDLLDLREKFDGQQKPVHKIDINGTLMVGVSNLDLWIERNRCKKVLFVGSDSLVSNTNLERYLLSLK